MKQYFPSIADSLTGIEQGRLSMRLRNKCCECLWYLLIEQDEFDQSLWDRLWRLEPDLWKFWNEGIYWDEIDDKPEVQAYFCATEYLWKDLHLVESYLFGVVQVAWVYEELERRLAWARSSLRRLWIAIVVCDDDASKFECTKRFHVSSGPHGAPEPATSGPDETALPRVVYLSCFVLVCLSKLFLSF